LVGASPDCWPKLCAKAIRERDGNRCQYTGRVLHPNEGSLDHVVPRSRCGKNARENLVWSAKEVNPSNLPLEHLTAHVGLYQSFTAFLAFYVTSTKLRFPNSDQSPSFPSDRKVNLSRQMLVNTAGCPVPQQSRRTRIGESAARLVLN
jgi:hypothetical protein